MTVRCLLALTFAVATLVPTAGDAVQMECVFVSTVGVAFGTYDVFTAAPTDSIGSITYRCTNVRHPATIRIDLQRGGSGSYTPRQMQSAAERLGYNLYLDATHTIVWGDGTGGTQSYGPLQPPESVNVTINVYGRTTSQQDVSVGAYTDAITATMSY